MKEVYCIKAENSLIDKRYGLMDDAPAHCDLLRRLLVSMAWVGWRWMWIMGWVGPW